MDKKKVFLVIQSILCIMLTVLLAAFALIIYFKGSAAKAADPATWIYSRELVGKYLLPVLPLAAITLIMAAVGILTGIRDEKQDMPVREIEMKKSPEGTSGRDGADKKAAAVILVVAIVFIVIGIANGSARDVLYKAITVCTECVGLG